MTAKPHVSIEPAPARWAELVRGWWSPGDERRGLFRREMGLPVDRPIVMSGHQAELWHPGILAKFFAAQAAAERVDGAPAWLIADQDANAGGVLEFPARDAAGRLVRERFVLATESGEGVPTGARPPIDSILGPDDSLAALDSVGAGISAIVDAVGAASSTTSLAAQLAEALTNLASPWLAPAPTIFATRLSGTSLFRELLGRLKNDPGGATAAYNAAVAESPAAGVAPLELSGELTELPLWRVLRGQPRERVYADELAGIDPAELTPRALLMTAIVRLAGCDLFIHGTGGGAYDRITERWIDRWLGEPLAPTTVVTADLPLPLPEANATEADLARATWRAQHARHNPSFIDDTPLAEKKRDLLAAIETAERDSPERRAHFADLHAILDRYRSDRAADLAELDAEPERLADALVSAAIARDRTWPFPLHDDAATTELCEAVTAGFRSATPKPCCCG